MKKIILPIILFLLLIFSTTTFAFGTEINCLKVMEEYDGWSLTLDSTNWSYTKTKPGLTKKNQDFCELAFNQAFEGRPVWRNWTKITYFSSKNDAAKALKKLTSAGTYYVYKQDNWTYLAIGYQDLITHPRDNGGPIYELVDGYTQVGQVVGNCLFERTLVSLIKENNTDNLQTSLDTLARQAYEGIIRQGAYKERAEFGDQQVETLTRSSTDYLFKESPLKKVCGSDTKETLVSAKDSENAFKNPRKEGDPKPANSPEDKAQMERNFDNFMRRLRQMLGETEIIINPLPSANLDIEIPKRSSWFDEAGDKFDFLPDYAPGQILKTNEPKKISLKNDNQKILLEVRPNQNLAVVGNFVIKNNRLYLENGEVEVKVSPQPGSTFGIETPQGLTTALHTHFLVNYDQNRNQTTVVVYDGEVEFKSANDKTTTISPSEDKPGVLVISQKFSPLKLGITGLALVAVIVGGIVLLKRKFAAKGASKKRK